MRRDDDTLTPDFLVQRSMETGDAMKAMCFSKPLEYRVEIPREEMRQAEPVEGRLIVTNRDAAALSGLTFAVGLAQGDFKDVKAGKPDALDLLEQRILAEGVALKPGELAEYAFRFDLPPDFPVKTKDSGPFLLYGGNLETPASRGIIDLPVAPLAALESFIAALENNFSFKIRGLKFSKGFLEARYKAPGNYPTVEELVAALRLDDQAATLRFRVRLQTLARGAAGGLKPRKREIERIVPRGEFLTPGGHPNRPLFRQVWQEVLDELTPGALNP